MNKITRWFKSKWFDWKYRNIDPDVCCCGGSISSKAYGGYGCIAGCMSQKEHIKGQYLKGEWK